MERDARSNRLLAEAVAELLRSWLAIRFLPFRWAVTSGSTVLGQPRTQSSVDQCVWAVTSASAHTPWRSVCFQQGLALQRMLRRRGVDARLHYGIGNAGELKAHVWVTVDDKIIIGGGPAPDYKCVAIYPEVAKSAS
jgi:hypothetical protein